MKFSIITVCYNPGDKIKTAIESVLSQYYPDIEYIIIDGGSTDGTVELVKSYGDKINTFISEPDKGLYDAFNKGINLATGEVIGFVNADDLLANSAILSKVAAEFAKSGADALYGDVFFVDKNNFDKIVRFWKSGQFTPIQLKYGWMPPHTALFVKRDIYKKTRLKNGEYFDTSLKVASDYDFMMRLLSKMQIKVIYLPVVLIKMRLGGISNKSLKNIIQKSKEDYIAMRRNSIGGLGTLIFKNLRKIPQFFH